VQDRAELDMVELDKVELDMVEQDRVVPDIVELYQCFGMNNMVFWRWSILC